MYIVGALFIGLGLIGFTLGKTIAEEVIEMNKDEVEEENKTVKVVISVDEEEVEIECYEEEVENGKVIIDVVAIVKNSLIQEEVNFNEQLT